MSFLPVSKSLPLPIGALFVASSCLLASCMCGSNGSSSSSGGGCGNISLVPSCEAGAPVPNGHQTGDPGYWRCAVACDPGFYDCNGRTDDGCEATSICPNPWDEPDGGDASTNVTEVSLDDVPHGLAVCGGVVYLIDGTVVESFSGNALDATPLAFLLAPPAGGLACDPSGAGVVFAELGLDAVAPTLVHVGPDAASAFGEVTDPAPGILADDGGIFWPERDDAGGARLVRWSGDASTALGPVDLSPVDKPFARGSGGTLVLVNGAVGSPDDAAVPMWDGGLRSIAAGDGIVGTADGVDGGSVVIGFDDGGVAWSKASSRTVRVVRRAGTDSYVGFDDAVGRIDGSGNLVMIALTQAHVADVAVDATWVWWVTLGEGSEPAKLHRAKR